LSAILNLFPHCGHAKCFTRSAGPLPFLGCMSHSFIGLSISSPHLAHFVTSITTPLIGGLCCAGLEEVGTCDSIATVGAWYAPFGYMNVPFVVQECACINRRQPTRLLAQVRSRAFGPPCGGELRIRRGSAIRGLTASELGDPVLDGDCENPHSRDRSLKL